MGGAPAQPKPNSALHDGEGTETVAMHAPVSASPAQIC